MLQIMVMCEIISAMSWKIVVSLPCDFGWSKNKMWVARRGTYARRLSREAATRKSMLSNQIQQDIHRNGITVVNAPLSFSIHAELPHHRGDAINFVDLVADSIELGTGLNDKWYSIDGVTWEVKPHFGMMTVTIEQKMDTNVQICGTCAQMVSFDHFGRGKNKYGIDTVCRSCKKKKRDSKKKKGGNG